MKNFEEVRNISSFPELAVERALNGIIYKEGAFARKTLSPSGLICPRAAAFKLSGYWQEGKEETYDSDLVMEMGTFVHERIQKFLRASDIWVEVEDYLKEFPELNIEINPFQKHAGETSLLFSGERGNIKVPPFSFQCDGIVKIDGEYYLVEIKSETERAWENRRAPNPKHALQGTAYSFLYGIKNILWIYASRESFGSHRKVYCQEVSKESVNSFIPYVQNIGKAVEAEDIGSLPRAKECRYCANVELCKELDLKKKQELEKDRV